VKTLRATLLAIAALVGTMAARAGVSEIKVDLRLDASDFVTGERIRGVVDIANSSPDNLAYGYPGAQDRVFVEIFRASDHSSLTRTSNRPFVAKFRIGSGEGQKFETFLGDHYALRETSRYLARPVLVHKGVRYEGNYRAFDVVEGVRIAGAMQLFATKPDLQREFSLVHWPRKSREHLFLRARDNGARGRVWETYDLGLILRIDKPTVSVLPTGEVVVLHRINQDQFLRTEFWSIPNAMEMHERETVRDPETAGTARVRELYKENGIKPKKNAWWKFW